MSELTEIDPWVKRPGNKKPIPAGAQLACGYWVTLALLTLEEEAYLIASDRGFELWTSTEGALVGRVAVAEGFSDPAIAARFLLDAVFRARVGFGGPVAFQSPGLVSEAEFMAIASSIKEDLEANRDIAEAEALAPIVEAARRLGLGPEPEGSGPHNWQSRCPGGNHGLMISSKSGQFGCGYCRRKGGVTELEQFVADRKAGLVGHRPANRQPVA